MSDKYLYPINGIISRTVASNHLTVAIKNFDNTNFSASAPLVYKIGDTPRTLSAALSVTVSAGTGTFNAGSAELAAKEIDYFLYLGWRASDSSMFILVSRIPNATTYADFSVTATNEKYGAYSGAAPASTDPVENIGRYNATLSATPFNWSVPATSVVINSPIFETRWLTFVPTFTGNGSLTYTSGTTNDALYKFSGEELQIVLTTSAGTAGGTTNTTISTTIPFTAGFTASIKPANGWVNNAGAYGVGLIYVTATGLNFRLYNSGNYTLGNVLFGGQAIVKY